jgi:copper resistance protein B
VSTPRLLVAALLALAGVAPAEEVDHSTMDHGATDDSAVDHSSTDHGEPSSAMITPVPPLTDADRATAHGSHSGHEHHDSDVHGYLRFDKLEYFHADGQDGFAWEAHGWLGTDIDRLWLRSDGARADGAFESADVELLYGRSFSAWWDVVGGVRQDFRPGDGRTWVAIGLQGLAPQRFEIAATAYARAGGHTAARFEAGYQLLFSNRLILQPMLDLWVYGKDDAARGIASGFSSVDAGVRLRYEFTRRIAPYLGFELERALGDTASLRRAAGQDVTGRQIVLGLRTWF